jgi:hypothetical protein
VLGALNAVTHQLITEINTAYINAESVCALLRKIASEAMLYALKSDTSSHVWKLWANIVANFALCFVGKSAMQLLMAS